MILFGALFVVVVALALLPGAIAGPLSWMLVGYVLFRAAPAVRSDLRALLGRRSVVVPRMRRGAWR